MSEAAPTGEPSSHATGKVTHEVDQRILEAYNYLQRVPGKDVRGQMIDGFQVWLKLPQEKLDAVKEVITMLHTASLMIDDIEDGSSMRRSVPAAHTIYGVPTALNTANYVYFIALKKVNDLGSPDATAVFIQECLNLHRGQGLDIMWRDTCSCPTEQDYRQMVLDKTGGLFGLAVGLLQCFSDPAVSSFAKSDFSPFVRALSLYFQIRDDFVNVCDSSEYAKTKGTFCEDLTEGKFSFPLIHSIKNSPPNDNRMLNLIRQRPTSLELKNYALQIMRETGSLQYTRSELRTLYSQCLEQLEALGGHPRLSKLLEKLDSQLDTLLEAVEGISKRKASHDEAAEAKPEVDRI